MRGAKSAQILPAKMRVFALAGLLLSGPAAADEYAHCYLRDAPADAPVSTGPNVSGLLSALQIATLRHACGADTTADQALLNGIVARGECSPESEIAGYVAATFQDPSEFMYEQLKSESSEEVMTRLCTATDACEAGENGYDDACKAAIDAALGG